MPSDFIQADLTRERLDVRVNDLLAGLEIDINRSVIADDDAAGRTPDIACSTRNTNVCTVDTCETCRTLCTKACLPGLDLDLGRDLGW
jgi:hypothetical protein